MKRFLLTLAALLLASNVYGQPIRASLQDGDGQEFGTEANPVVVSCVGGSCGDDLPTTPASTDCLIGYDSEGTAGCYTSFNMLSSSINWTSLNEIGQANINWTDIQALNGAGMGGRVNSKEVNINMANPTTGLALVWRNMTGMVYNLTKLFANSTASSQAVLLYATGDVAGGVNWVDVQTIGTLNINVASGTTDGINWTSTKDLGLSDINWTTIDNYGYVAVNWTSGAPTDANIGLQGYLTGAGK